MFTDKRVPNAISTSYKQATNMFEPISRLLFFSFILSFLLFFRAFYYFPSFSPRYRSNVDVDDEIRKNVIISKKL